MLSHVYLVYWSSQDDNDPQAKEIADAIKSVRDVLNYLIVIIWDKVSPQVGADAKKPAREPSSEDEIKRDLSNKSVYVLHHLCSNWNCGKAATPAWTKSALEVFGYIHNIVSRDISPPLCRSQSSSVSLSLPRSLSVCLAQGN